jgi:hypothetical protein
MPPLRAWFTFVRSHHSVAGQQGVWRMHAFRSACWALVALTCAVAVAACGNHVTDQSLGTAATADGRTPAPVAGHPRLLITGHDVARLRSWASPRNPMYARGLARLARAAKADMDAGKVPGQDTGSDAYDQFTTEAYAELFAFMSLIERRAPVRADYGRRARSLLMYVMGIAGRGPGDDGQPFRDPRWATFDRSRWYGEAFALTVDWAYPYFSASDKKLIRKVFLRWSREQFDAYPLDSIEGAKAAAGWHGERPRADREPPRRAVGAQQLLPRARAQPGADGPGARPPRRPGQPASPVRQGCRRPVAVRGRPRAADRRRGGLSPEGFQYGPDALGRIAQLIRALRTAGQDGAGAARRLRLAEHLFWPASIAAFLSSLPTRPTRLKGELGYLGDVYQPAWFGDAQDYWAGDPITLFGPIALDAAARGDRKTVEAVRWIETNVPAGGRAALYDRVGKTDQFFAAILYFLVFEPGARAPADPRPALPTQYWSAGLGRTIARTCWCADERIFAHKLTWNEIDHQVGDGNDFALFRAGEWLTKQRAMYAGGYSDYKNVLAIGNDAPGHNEPDDARHRVWLTGGQWDATPAGDPDVVARSSGDGYVALTGDATNLYNSDYEGVGDVKHASRSIVWLEPDHLVVYDRATTAKTDRFKRFWLQLPSAPDISDGGRAVAHTARGQQLFITSLLPERATLSGSRYADEGEPANAEPMGYRLSIEDESKPKDARFLTVLQGADRDAPGDAVARVRSAAGTAYDGAVADGQAVLFRRDLSAPFERTVVEIPADGLRRIFVTGLVASREFAVGKETAGGKLRLTVSPGRGSRAGRGRRARRRCLAGRTSCVTPALRRQYGNRGECGHRPTTPEGTTPCSSSCQLSQSRRQPSPWRCWASLSAWPFWRSSS